MTTQPPPAGASHFTFDQILYFARLVQQIRGATLHSIAAGNDETQRETILLPNDFGLVQAFQRLQGEAINPSGSTENGGIIHLIVAGLDIRITKSYEGEQASHGDAFVVWITPYNEKTRTHTRNQDSGQQQKVHEYHVFDDYLTSFLWAASEDGLKEEVLDDSLPMTLTSGLADDLRKWTDTYDTNFRLRGCDQGSGLDVFPTISEIITWTVEGAILSTRMAVETGVPVVYSAYLRRGNEYRFVGDALNDGATLVDLVLRLNKHLTTVRPTDSQVEGILRLRNDG